MPEPATVWNELTDAHAATLAAAPATGEIPEHRPIAAVLGCSDARVDPSLLFGQPAGRLFVVRLAGNTASPTAVASLTYAVESLGVPLVIVLGHTSCGAVTAAFSHSDAEALAPILAPIDEMLAACTSCDSTDATAYANVRHNVARLRCDPGPLGDAVRDGRVAVAGAIHDLATGRLVEVEVPVGYVA
jgi:carbonic anhydrase